MNKRLFKKALAAVLTAALIFTSNGITPTNVSAAEKIYVEGVYTNFQKATMSTGTTKQIKAYVDPVNATIQKMSYKSSDVKVATVSKTGLVTAIAAGTTTITVSALDGSSEQEKIKITVLKDLTITKKDVDSDNEVIVMDRTYGNVTISESVGDAEIYLAGVTIKGLFTLNEGNYTVSMYESTAKKVVIDKAAASDEISSLAVTEDGTNTPTLFVGEDTKIAEINAKISVMIKQGNGSQIDGLTFEQDSNGKIKLFLDNYTGTLSIDAAFGDIELVATGCNIADIVVTGGANVGAVRLTNAGNSAINNLTLMGAAKVDLAIPTTKVQIDSSAKGTSFTSAEDIGTINNAGTESKIKVAGAIGIFDTMGVKALIDVAATSSVPLINISGEGSTLSGAGDVSEVNVTASDCSISTVNTLVTVGNVTGTLVQGKPTEPGSSVPTAPIQTGGGGGGGTVPEEDEILAGAIIVNNDYEDGLNSLAVTMGSGTVTTAIVDGGNGSDKALLVSTRGANYHGVGFNFYQLLNKHITVSVKFDIKCSENGTLQATMKSNNGYAQIAQAADTTADTWYTLEGTFELGNTITEASMYIETPGTSSYYLDNVEIIVSSIGEAILVTGVSLDKDTLVLDTGATGLLVATIAPSTADNKTVTWLTSDSSVATVADGVVRGIGAGTATITAKTLDGDFTDTCAVTVSSSVALALDYGTVLLQSIGATKEVKANVNTGIVWTTLDSSVATVVNGTITAVNYGTTTVTATLGMTSVSCEVVVSNTVIYYEDFEADTNSLPNQGSWAITPTVLTDENEAYNGSKYLKVENLSLYNGNLITLNNSTGLTEATFVITSFVKAATANIGVEYFHDNSALGYTINKVTAEPTAWTKLETSINVAAGGSITVRLISSAVGTYLLDSIYVTKTLAAPDLSDHAITGVTLNKSTLTLAKNATETITATIAPTNYTTSGTITWTSSNSSVATVNSAGLVTAAASGSAIITATTAIDGVSTLAKTATCNVIVTDEVIPVTIFSSGFEVGSTHGLTGSTGIAYVDGGYNSSSKSLLIDTSTVGWGNPGYSLTASKGNTVTIIAYMKHDAGEAGELKATVQLQAGTDSYPQTAISVASGTWTKFVLTVDLPESTTNARLYFEKNSSSITSFNLDNVLIYEGTAIQAEAAYSLLFPTVPTGPTVIYSTDFENGTNPFTEWPNNVITNGATQNGGVFAVSGSAMGYISDKSLSVTADAGYKGIGYKFVEAKTYKITARVKNIGSGTTIQLYDQTGNSTLQTFTINSTDWTLVEFTITITATKVVILAPNWSSGANNFLVDDFIIYEVNS